MPSFRLISTSVRRKNNKEAWFTAYNRQSRAILSTKQRAFAGTLCEKFLALELYMSNQKLSEARKLCAKLQSSLLDLSVDYTMVAKNSTHNKPCATALDLWNELNRGHNGLVPEKTDWVPVTKKRLNSAMKRLNIAQG